MKDENVVDWGKATTKKPYLFISGPESPCSLETFLSDKVEKAPWLIVFGAVYINGSRNIDKEKLVTSKDVLRVHINPKRYPFRTGELEERIVFENEDFLIINKPSGLPMHPTLDNLHENLIGGFGKKLFVTHRLDVPTSGLVLVAKSKEYQIAFNEIIYRREIKKIYEAHVLKSPTQNISTGELFHYMKKSVAAPKIIMREKPNDMTLWQECRLKINSVRENKLTIELLTGRTHQIRAQLAFEGLPILGDEMYGGPQSSYFGLKSTFLSFKCPKSGEQRSFELT
jgi:23S rRNA pseudouridine1911/1915/1917 synthase